MFEAIEQFKNAMFEHGIEPPEQIIADGALHRFKIAGKLNGAYVLHLNGRAAGWFQDFKQGIEQRWKLDGYTQKLSRAERQAFAEQRHEEKRAREAEQASKHAIAANKAKYIWHNAKPAVEHPYLTRKQVQPHRAKLYKNSLVLPLLNEALELVNLQFIDPEGNKRFLAGGHKQGCFWWIGKPNGKILIAEGFATAASIYEHSGDMTVIAFDAGNLEPVARIFRAKHPDTEIIIMADNDVSGKGQEAARKAALAIGGKYLVCPLIGGDFNDYLKGV